MIVSYTGFEQCFLKEGEPFFPRFQSVTLDLSSTSSLKWEIPKSSHLILWELETDLWERPFPDEGEIRAFEQAIDHFIETIFDPEKSFGILLYKGGLDFPRDLVKSIAARLPDEAFPFLALDGLGLSTQELLRELKREELQHFGLIVKGGTHPYALPAMGWDQDSPYGVYGEGRVLPQREVPLALVQPEEGEFTLPKELCRVIPEQLLIYEWDGVDALIVPPSISSEGQRKVNGFLATGGQVLQSI